MGLLNFLGSLLGLSGAPGSRIEVQKSPAASGLNIVYGRRRVQPVTVFKIASTKDMDISNSGAYDHYVSAYNTSREGNKDEKTWLHRIDVWGQGEIEEIVRFWIDGDPSTATRFHKRPYFRAASKYGSETQLAATELASGDGEWASTHNGYGVAYTWARFFNSTKYPEFTSEPQLSALVKGVKMYDPRKADHDFDDPSTWEYSNNRALVILNYLMAEYGFHASEDEIDLESFKLAANVCAEKVDIPPVPTNQTGVTVYDFYDQTRGEWLEILPGEIFQGQQEEQEGTTRRKYVANAVVDPKEGVIPNLRYLMEGMGWALPWSNGKIKLVIESEGKSPVLSFDEDSIVGGGMIERSMRADRWNRVTVEFPNSNKAFEQDTVSWPALDSTEYADYLAEDAGKAMHKLKTANTITNYYVAQSYAEYLVRKSRVSPRITGLKLTAKALLLEPGDIISLTDSDRGFDGDEFIVEKVSIGVDLSVLVDLLAYVESVYDPSLVDEEPLNDLPYGPEIWADPTAITGLELIETYQINADGSVINGLNVNWSGPTAPLSIIYYEVFWKTSDGDYQSFPNSKLLTAVTDSTEITGLVDQTDYTVAVRYMTSNGKRSDLVYDTIQLTATESKLSQIQDNATATNPRGDYDDSETYYYGDIVLYEGSSYICRAVGSIVGVEPDDSSNWQWLGSEAGVTHFSQNTTPSTSGLVDGSIWFKPSDRELYILENGAWTDITNSISTYIQNSAPTYVEGGYWYDENDRIAYIGHDGSWEAVGNHYTYVSDLIASRISIAINEKSNGSSDNSSLRFFGLDGEYPDRGTEAKIVKPDGTEFEWGGTTGTGESTAYSGNNSNGVYYLVVDTTGDRRFDHTGRSENHVGVVKSIGGSTLEYFHSNVGWDTVSHDDDMIVIGWCERRSNAFVGAWLFEPCQVEDAPPIFSLVGIDTPDLLPIESVAGVFTMDPINPCTGSDNGSSAKISIASTTVYFGDFEVDYNSGSVTGLSFNKDYWVYAVDDNFTGGSVTYQVSTSRTGLPAKAVYFGYCKTPANGGSNTSSSSGGFAGGGGAFDPNYDIP